jgi:hypothetical protein
MNLNIAFETDSQQVKKGRKELIEPQLIPNHSKQFTRDSPVGCETLKMTYRPTQ